MEAHGCTDDEVRRILLPWVDKMTAWQHRLCAAAATLARCRFWSGMEQADARELLGAGAAGPGAPLPTEDRGSDARSDAKAT